MPAPAHIENLLRNIAMTAVGNVKRDGYVTPVALILKDATLEPMLLDLESDAAKRKSIELVSKKITEIKADILVVVAEAWGAKYDAEKTDLRPSQRSDRQEMIVVTVVTRAKCWVMTLPFTRMGEDIVDCQSPAISPVYEAESIWQEAFGKYLYH